MTHLGFGLREGQREEELRLVPAPVDTLSLWGCLLSSSWLPGTAWLAGTFTCWHQVVRQLSRQGQERRVCVSWASWRKKAMGIQGHRTSFLSGEKGLELDKVGAAYCGHPYYSQNCALKTGLC